MNLNSKIQYLIGVGPKMAEKLNRLGIETVSDLIFYYPRTYKDFSNITRISDIRYSNKEPITIKGNIIGIVNKKTSRRRFTVTEAVVEDGGGSIKVIWFNQPFLAKILKPGQEVILNGKVQYNFFSKEVVMESPERAMTLAIIPIYSETAGLSSRYIGRLISGIRYQVLGIREWMPSPILTKYELLGIQEALLNIHQPKNREMLEQARRRIAFDELFLIALRADLSKIEIKKENAPIIDINDKNLAIAKFLSFLPYKLTDDQRKAAWQILKDLEKDTPMNRLLNGDVGSGKTVVAAIAAFATVRAGFRVAVMAPTSILANQHYETFCGLFERQHVSIGLYTRERKKCSLRNKKQETITKQITNSNPPAGGQKSKKLNSEFLILNSNIIIGTQALIQSDVKLENIGLVIVDEQHRFGVKQRQALLELGKLKTQNSKLETNSKLQNSKSETIKNLEIDKLNENCEMENGKSEKMRSHFLSMTATPIPRTLHLALFGDLDISVIKEKPKNRKEIITKIVEAQNREKAYGFIKAHIKAGRQAFVICPLIEENKDNRIHLPAGKAGITDNSLGLFKDERKTVKTEYEKLQKIFPEFNIGMLHGKMKAKEKDEIMSKFNSAELDILVSTSVVEVGVDIPNATVMMIEDAERFGLAQIHQFRGRVGRAEHQSFCFLFSPTLSPRAIERLRSLEATSDGFKLAEIDLETRGPGAVFGTEQSGLLDLKMANFSDRVLIEQASSAAKSIIENDPELKNHLLLKEEISDYLQTKHLE